MKLLTAFVTALTLVGLAGAAAANCPDASRKSAAHVTAESTPAPPIILPDSDADS